MLSATLLSAAMTGSTLNNNGEATHVQFLMVASAGDW
jgi:hypothetical protein